MTVVAKLLLESAQRMENADSDRDTKRGEDMNTAFFAKAVSFSDDGDATVLAFADDPIEPANYVILDLANEPDEQELRLGLDGVHIEAGPLRVDGYDLVRDIRQTDAGIVISLTPDAARKAGAGQDIEIELPSKIVDGIPIGEAVRRFKDRLSSSEEPRVKDRGSA